MKKLINYFRNLTEYQRIRYRLNAIIIILLSILIFFLKITGFDFLAY